MPAACGGAQAVQSRSVAPPPDVAAAVQKTEHIATYKASFEGATESAGQTVQTTGEGEFDAKSKRGHMNLTSTIAGTGVDMELVMAWPLMYMRFPPELGAQLPPGKDWVKFDMERLGKQLGFDLQQLMQAGQADPTQGLGYLRGMTNVTAVGTEEVRGVETTHYRGVVDFHRLAIELPEARDSIEQLMKLAKVDRVPTDVWVGHDGLVRRMKYTYDMQLSGQPTKTTMQTDLYDFGTDVHVTIPPDDTTVDITQLIGNA
jgi:LppX_LprAFG lipoprotein